MQQIYSKHRIDNEVLNYSRKDQNRKDERDIYLDRTRNRDQKENERTYQAN